MKSKTLLPIIAVAILYVFSILIQILIPGTKPGVFDAIREIVKAVLCVGIAFLFLRRSSSPEIQVKKPGLEATLGLATFGLTFAVLTVYWIVPQLLFPRTLGSAINKSVGVDPAVIWVVLAMVAIPIAVWLKGKYSWKDVGLGVPKVRGLLTWLVTFAIAVTLAFALAASYGVNFLQTYFPDLLSADTIKWLFLAYLPEELLFRVYLQTRLEKLAGPRWAILIVAVLFNLLHAPQQLIGNGWSIQSIIANVLLPVNGLIGGYVWLKTRNLPVLLLYHMTIYQL